MFLNNLPLENTREIFDCLGLSYNSVMLSLSVLRLGPFPFRGWRREQVCCRFARAVLDDLREPFRFALVACRIDADNVQIRIDEEVEEAENDEAEEEQHLKRGQMGTGANDVIKGLREGFIEALWPVHTPRRQ